MPSLYRQTPQANPVTPQFQNAAWAGIRGFGQYLKDPQSYYRLAQDVPTFWRNTISKVPGAIPNALGDVMQMGARAGDYISDEVTKRYGKNTGNAVRTVLRSGREQLVPSNGPNYMHAVGGWLDRSIGKPIHTAATYASPNLWIRRLQGDKDAFKNSEAYTPQLENSLDGFGGKFMRGFEDISAQAIATAGVEAMAKKMPWAAEAVRSKVKAHQAFKRMDKPLGKPYKVPSNDVVDFNTFPEAMNTNTVVSPKDLGGARFAPYEAPGGVVHVDSVNGSGFSLRQWLHEAGGHRTLFNKAPGAVNTQYVDPAMKFELNMALGRGPNVSSKIIENPSLHPFVRNELAADARAAAFARKAGIPATDIYQWHKANGLNAYIEGLRSYGYTRRAATAAQQVFRNFGQKVVPFFTGPRQQR